MDQLVDRPRIGLRFDRIMVDRSGVVDFVPGALPVGRCGSLRRTFGIKVIEELPLELGSGVHSIGQGIQSIFGHRTWRRREIEAFLVAKSEFLDQRREEVIETRLPQIRLEPKPALYRRQL